MSAVVPKPWVQRLALPINVLLFQAGWFACVLGAAMQVPWVGVLAALFVIGWHLARAQQPRAESFLVLLAVLLGMVFESLLVQMGWIRFNSGVFVLGLAPYWMGILWAMFATTLNVSLRWLRPRLGLAALLGAVGGPLSYYAGARMGALEFVNTGLALTAVAFGWALLAPLLLLLARRLDGYPQA